MLNEKSFGVQPRRYSELPAAPVRQAASPPSTSLFGRMGAFLFGASNSAEQQRAEVRFR